MDFFSVKENVFYKNPVYGEGIVYQDKVYYAYSQFAREIVEQGNGATLLPEMAIKHLHLAKQTSLIRFHSPAPKRTIGLCWLKNNRKKQDFITIAEYIRTIHSKNH